MEITALFRACVELARKQNKDLDATSAGGDSSSVKNGHITGKSSAPSQQPSKSKIFPGKKSEYYGQAKDLLKTLKGLQSFLLETRVPYLNIGSHSEVNTKTQFPTRPHTSETEVPEFTNAERDQVDQDVQQIIQNCQKRIFEFQKMIETTGAETKQPQLFTHLESISTSLGVYLKDICDYYSEMRAIRVKRTVDFQAMARLSKTTDKSANNPSTSSRNTFSQGKPSTFKPGVSSTPTSSARQPAQDVEYQMSSAASAYFEDDEELTPEAIQLLEAENAQLYHEFNTLSDEVDQIQTNVVQIAQLQSVFTEKVLQQDKDITMISNLVIGSTENIKGGNEQIRQAIQQSADFRAWVLFFIIVMSLSLLFLDWYND